MGPDGREFDEEIRGHLALEVKARIDQGEDPEAARWAALRQFGNVTLARESMQAVWRPRWLESLEALSHDIRVALRSLRYAKGLSATVALTLALGIGANAAIFSVVRQVLLRPLVNRDEDRLVYLRQSAPTLGVENAMFSVPEIEDLRSGAPEIGTFGDFSTIDLTMAGLGEPRVVNAGVVSGSYFDVMGLRPAFGRLIGPQDDGPDADPVAVLTHRFWSTALQRDPGVIGKAVRLGSRRATIVGVLEPSVPYPADTEIIANVATSPHHLGAVMVTARAHRMTEVFARLAPGLTLADARAALTAAHAEMLRKHPDAYAAARMQLSVTPLRDQIAAPARPVLLYLVVAAAIVFVIACSNVANLLLARAVRRERELSVRAALGASPAALRRSLLAESLVLCGIGALLGVLLARPFVAIVARYAARFSVRALDVTLDTSVVWVGAALAIAAAVALAYIPRLPSIHTPDSSALGSRQGLRQAGGGVRLAPSTNRRLRVFAVAQIGLSFVLLAGAGMLLATLVSLQRTNTGYNMRQVLAIDVPLPLDAGRRAVDFYEDVSRRIARLPGVKHVAVGSFVPWRDVTSLLPAMAFAVEGYTPADGEEEPRGRIRNITPGFFAAVGVPILAGRDFTDEDRHESELVVIVSHSVARRLFHSGNVLNRTLWWTEPVFGRREPRRIVGVVADVDDENVVPTAAMTIYHPLRQIAYGGRVFVHTEGDPYAIVAPATRIIRQMAPEQPVERAATLEDVRAQVLAPERLNAFVFSGFAGVALLVAVVGVAGVLAFSVSARTREFGVRLAVGSTPSRLMLGVLSEGARIVAIGIAAGGAGGYALARTVAMYGEGARLPAAGPVLGAGAVLIGAAILALLMPAARASRVDLIRALRSE